MKMFLLGFLAMSFIDTTIMWIFEEKGKDTAFPYTGGPFAWLAGFIIVTIIQPLIKLYHRWYYKGLIFCNDKIYWVYSEDFDKIFKDGDNENNVIKSISFRIGSLKEKEAFFEKEKWDYRWWGKNYKSCFECSTRYAPRKVWSKYPKYPKYKGGF